jgi:hypothetical protein
MSRPFICGVGGYDDGNILPRIVIVCPAEGSDYTAVYVRSDEVARLRLALRIIAGEEQCLDNLMSNADVAREALKSR